MTHLNSNFVQNRLRRLPSRQTIKHYRKSLAIEWYTGNDTKCCTFLYSSFLTNNFTDISLEIGRTRRFLGYQGFTRCRGTEIFADFQGFQMMRWHSKTSCLWPITNGSQQKFLARASRDMSSIGSRDSMGCCKISSLPSDSNRFYMYLFVYCMVLSHFVLKDDGQC